jgi:hypothetical protein
MTNTHRFISLAFISLKKKEYITHYFHFKRYLLLLKNRKFDDILHIHIYFRFLSFPFMDRCNSIFSWFARISLKSLKLAINMFRLKLTWKQKNWTSLEQTLTIFLYERAIDILYKLILWFKQINSRIIKNR